MQLFIELLGQVNDVYSTLKIVGGSGSPLRVLALTPA